MSAPPSPPSLVGSFRPISALFRPEQISLCLQTDSLVAATASPRLAWPRSGGRLPWPACLRDRLTAVPSTSSVRSSVPFHLGVQLSITHLTYCTSGPDSAPKTPAQSQSPPEGSRRAPQKPPEVRAVLPRLPIRWKHGLGLKRARLS